MSEQETTRPPDDRPEQRPEVEPGDDGDQTASITSPICDLCGTPMITHHCKMVCTNCGYTRDCSDP